MSRAQSSPRRRSRAIEAEMDRIKVDDVLLQTLVSLINLGARKAGLAAGPARQAPEPDLEQTQPGDRRRPRAAAAPRAAPRRASSARSRTRSRGCRWPTRSCPAATPRRPREPAAPKRRRQPGPAQAVRPPLGPRASSRRGRLPRAHTAARSRAVVSLCLSPEGFFLSSFLSDHGALSPSSARCSPWSYGAVTTRSLLALSPGNETMQRLSPAIQEGASAYLRRQYTTIGVVGVVLFIALIPLQNIEVAIGFRSAASPPRRPASSA